MARRHSLPTGCNLPQGHGFLLEVLDHLPETDVPDNQKLSGPQAEMVFGTDSELTSDLQRWETFEIQRLKQCQVPAQPLSAVLPRKKNALPRVGRLWTTGIVPRRAERLHSTHGLRRRGFLRSTSYSHPRPEVRRLSAGGHSGLNRSAVIHSEYQGDGECYRSVLPQAPASVLGQDGWTLSPEVYPASSRACLHLPEDTLSCSLPQDCHGHISEGRIMPDHCQDAIYDRTQAPHTPGLYAGAHRYLDLEGQRDAAPSYLPEQGPLAVYSVGHNHVEDLVPAKNVRSDNGYMLNHVDAPLTCRPESLWEWSIEQTTDSDLNVMVHNPAQVVADGPALHLQASASSSPAVFPDCWEDLSAHSLSESYTYFDDIDQTARYASSPSFQASFPSDFQDMPIPDGWDIHTANGRATAEEMDIAPVNVEPRARRENNTATALELGTLFEHSLECKAVSCSHRAATVEALRRHNAEAHEHRHHCDFGRCLWSFRHAKDLERHQTSVHTVDRPFKCVVFGCKYRVEGFSRADNLKRHAEKKHSSLGYE